uniref:Uncharacterized protein n=1 Tax=Octopus bimaculoides TaxID=37653 RepID=A0A0L8FGQ5_OCTBM
MPTAILTQHHSLCHFHTFVTFFQHPHFRLLLYRVEEIVSQPHMESTLLKPCEWLW